MISKRRTPARLALAAALLTLPLALAAGCRDAAESAGTGFNRGAAGTIEPQGGQMPAGSVPVGDPHALEAHPDAAGK